MDLELTVGEFVSLLNQTLEFAYTGVTIVGELANFRVSKNRWIYFDLKDNEASVKFFGTVYQLPGPLEDGLMVAVRGTPRLHPQYGFSVTAQNITPVGEGSIKKVAALLEVKLAAEGLFDVERKRLLPYPPRHIGLITSSESAAYHDFTKIIAARWSGIRITLIDAQVQGQAAPAQVVAAIQQFNQFSDQPEVLVITRGGGSAEDLQAFNTEQVTRAVAASRIPTLVAIGHEIDISLSELAADQRASTPSNAAELLVPDRKTVLAKLANEREHLARLAGKALQETRRQLAVRRVVLWGAMERITQDSRQTFALRTQLLAALDPNMALQRGYVLVRKGGKVIRRGQQLRVGQNIVLQFADTRISAEVRGVQ